MATNSSSDKPKKGLAGSRSKYFSVPVLPEVNSDNYVLRPLGFPYMESIEESTALGNFKTGYDFNINRLKEFIVDQEKTTKVRPVLISFSGLPECGKSMAVEHFLQNYVDSCPLTPVTRITERDQAAGICHYELIAAGVNSPRDLCITEGTQESSLAAGILSAFKQDFITKGKIPLFDLITTQPDLPFDNRDLDDHLQFIYRYLCMQGSIPKAPMDDSKKLYGERLRTLLPEGIALINIWDIAISETVRHFLTALRGHLYNNHLWLFLDLDRDLDRLHETPEITETEGKGDGAIFMKWRPRFHYLLRYCQIMKNFSQEKQRKKVCTIFAKHKGLTNGELQEKVEKLEEKVKPAAERIGVSSLLEDKIQTISLGKFDDTDDKSKLLYQKFQQSIFETSFVKIPLSWVFLRCLFYRYQKEVVSRKELELMAKKCEITKKSFEEFCKFYTSFGSIIDLSLVNPNYKYVIVKPVRFLSLLDSFLNPSDKLCQTYPTLPLGIVPEEAFKEAFGVDWPAYVDALVSLNFATKVSIASLDISTPVDRNEMYYYITLSRSRTAPLISEVDRDSVHVITDIDTPHIFKQVALTRHLLDTLPSFKLGECPNMNRTIMKDDSTTLTIVSHSPATRLHLNQPNLEVCSRIVEAYQDIARSCNVVAKYKFVSLCVDDAIPNVQSIPSSRYHILPDEKLCDKCREAGKTESELLKVWNEALTKCPIDESSKPPGDLTALEIAKVADKIDSFKIKAQVLIEFFKVSDLDQFKEYTAVDQEPIIADDKIANEIILAWRKSQRSHGNKEIKRSFVKKLSELGKKLDESQRKECEKIAKEIDA